MSDKCPHCGWAPDDDAYTPPGFDWETWTDPQFMLAASATLLSALLWHVEHRHDWSDPEDDESYERALHTACTLLIPHIEP